MGEPLQITIISGSDAPSFEQNELIGRIIGVDLAEVASRGTPCRAAYHMNYVVVVGMGNQCNCNAYPSIEPRIER